MHLKGNVAERSEPEVLSSGSQPKWLQHLGLGQSKARSFSWTSRRGSGSRLLGKPLLSPRCVCSDCWMGIEQPELTPAAGTARQPFNL